MLNTQMASWSQLRHDTILYAKQSYTDSIVCEFPDAYVDPYPAFYKAIVDYSDKGAQVASSLMEFTSSAHTALLEEISDYFTELGFAADILGQMAQQQLDGVPYTEEQLGFINDAIQIEEEDAGCTTAEFPAGWYKRLFFQPMAALEYDPTIADVHTQTSDESGMPVGYILHVGTGAPRIMTVAVNQCDGPRAYVGVVFSYYERITKDFERLTDEEWSSILYQTHHPEDAIQDVVPQADVPWMSEFIVKK